MSGTSQRSRSLTGKGILYQFGLLQDKRRNLDRRGRNIISKLQKHFVEDNLVEVSNSYDKLCAKFEDFMAVHGKCQILLDEEEREEDDVGVDQLNKIAYSLKERVRSLMNQKEFRMETSRLEASCTDTATQTYTSRAAMGNEPKKQQNLSNALKNQVHCQANQEHRVPEVY